MDLKGSIPCFIRITGGSVHDVNFLDELPIESGAFYIMDRGYIDYARINYRTVDKATGFRNDQTIMLQGLRSSQDYPVPLRRVSYYDADTNKRLIFLTNIFTLDALTIAKLYKCRYNKYLRRFL